MKTLSQSPRGSARTAHPNFGRSIHAQARRAVPVPAATAESKSVHTSTSRTVADRMGKAGGIRPADKGWPAKPGTVRLSARSAARSTRRRGVCCSGRVDEQGCVTRGELTHLARSSRARVAQIPYARSQVAVALCHGQRDCPRCQGNPRLAALVEVDSNGSAALAPRVYPKGMRVESEQPSTVGLANRVALARWRDGVPFLALFGVAVVASTGAVNAWRPPGRRP